MSIKIKAENIFRTYKIRNASGNEGDHADKQNSDSMLALDDVSLEIKEGEFLALVGPSGCGKSTFLDILGGLAIPSEGSIYVDNKPVKGPGLDRGIVFQGYALFPWRTIQQNIEFGFLQDEVDKAEEQTTESIRSSVASEHHTWETQEQSAV